MQSDYFSTPNGVGRHPSFEWNPALRAKPPFVRDPVGFAKAMDNRRYPLAGQWSPEWIFHNSMGPINLWGCEALSRQVNLQPGNRVLDLGCGTASSSIFLAMEFGVEVWAADLWIDPEDNRKRIEGAGLGAQIHPVRADAHGLPYELGFFDAIVSIDSYHYFGTEVRYLSYLAQFVRLDGVIGIVVPANERDPDESGALRPDPQFLDEMGADWFTFRSASWWRRHWSYTPCIDIECVEMIEQSSEDWQRWIDAELTAYGSHPQVDLNARMLASPAAAMGFVLATAKRNGRPIPDLGIGEFKNRIS